MTRQALRQSVIALALLVPTVPSLAQETLSGSGLLYGRVTTLDGTVHEGRLRWGNGQEALWSHYYNGRKTENRWAEHAPEDELPTERHSIGAFGFELIGWTSVVTLERPFMTRFGDITRIEPTLQRVRITRKSGDVIDLNRFEADDLADGVRVWDEAGKVSDIDEWQIRSIEFLPTPPGEAGPAPLFGTVHTSAGSFTGLVQWDRNQSLSTDELYRGSGEVDERPRFENVRSIARWSADTMAVTFEDGRETVLPHTSKPGRTHLGVYVDDARYGRVLVSWDVLQRIDFQTDGHAPSYDAFRPGHQLEGTVTTRDGRRASGRLVFDLDEAETTDTLDAPSGGVDYTIPFSLVSSITLPFAPDRLPPARVILQSGEELSLEPAGDLAEWNGGMLVFAGDDSAEYVPWAQIARVDFAQR